MEDANVPLPDIELKTDNFLREIVITTEEIADILKIINSKKAFCRLSKTYDSFIPSTIRHWNSLDPSLRYVVTIAKFKTELRKGKYISQVPKHYEIGPRKLNIILIQLRCFASLLNYTFDMWLSYTII